MAYKKDEVTDSVLLERYAQGDPEAFECFFLRHRGRVYQYVLRRVHRPEAAVELTQDIFLKLHATIHLYQSDRPALNWFFTMVHNTCVDYIRKSSRDLSLARDGGESAHDRNSHMYSVQTQSASADSDTERVFEALNSLPQDQRKIVEGRVLDDRSFSSLSHETGKSELALRKTYSRAVQKIRALLGSVRDSGEEQ